MEECGEEGGLKISAEGVGAFIGDIYDAAAQPALWPRTLDRLGESLGGAAMVMSALHRSEGIKLALATRQDPAAFQVIKERFNSPQTNAFVAAMPMLPVGAPVRRSRVQDDAAYFGSGLYNEVFRPQGLAHRAIACVHRTETLFCPMGVLRPTSAGEFSEQQLRWLHLLLPHFGRAIELSLRIGSLQDSARLTQQALDRLPLGLLIVDTDANVAQLNQAAETLVAAQDGLRISHGRLEAWLHDDTLAIGSALSRALARDAGAGTVSVRRPSGQRPYVLVLAPLGPQSSVELGAAGRNALVLVSDPGRPSHARSVRELFGLTPREGELVGALLDGKRLDEYADEQGVSINTVKTQLRAIFAKTSTSRQGELIGLLQRIPRVTDTE